MMDCVRLFMCVHERDRETETEALIALHCPERQAKCISTIVSRVPFSHQDSYGMCRMRFCELRAETRLASKLNQQQLI